jgi:YgiT-type zinc finger domain-containing protein
MLKTGKVICPTCGGEVVEFDNIDIYVDDTTVTLFKVGECDHCGNHYQWHEEYALAGYRDLEQTHDESEDEPDDPGCGFDPYEGYIYDC